MPIRLSLTRRDNRYNNVIKLYIPAAKDISAREIVKSESKRIKNKHDLKRRTRKLGLSTAGAISKMIFQILDNHCSHM